MAGNAKIVASYSSIVIDGTLYFCNGEELVEVCKTAPNEQIVTVFKKTPPNGYAQYPFVLINGYDPLRNKNHKEEYPFYPPLVTETHAYNMHKGTQSPEGWGKILIKPGAKMIYAQAKNFYKIAIFPQVLTYSSKEVWTKDVGGDITLNNSKDRFIETDYYYQNSW